MKCALCIFSGGRINEPKHQRLLGTGSVTLDRLRAKSIPIPARREESCRAHKSTK